jgi:hypothetical protein
MTGLWCLRNNSIFEMAKDPENYRVALLPCRKEACEHWNDGECFDLERRGK